MNNEQLSPEEALERYAAEQEKAFRKALGNELFEMLEEICGEYPSIRKPPPG